MAWMWPACKLMPGVRRPPTFVGTLLQLLVVASLLDDVQNGLRELRGHRRVRTGQPAVVSTVAAPTVAARLP